SPGDPSGPPVALDLRIANPPDPWFVAMRSVHLTIAAVDATGGAAAVNSVVTLETTDARSRLNGAQVPLVNGAVTVRVQWFTAGEHSITAASREGLRGRVEGIRVQALPADTAITVERPTPWPKYAWAGGAFQAVLKVTGGGRPLGGIEVYLEASRGVRNFPHDLYTSDDSGSLVGIIFPPDFQ
ncbi:MAG TPA: hypothetical protein VI643_01570, partial [Planctomycetota bacterium]|nr:hypothetical protein [Planctomycetota bacterium]